MTTNTHEHAAPAGTIRIGGTDASTIMGANRFQTLNYLWQIKTGRLEKPDLSQKEEVYWGRVLEVPVLLDTLKRLGETYDPANREVWLEDGWHVGYADYRIDPQRIVEIKTTGHWSLDEWEQGVPDYYFWQVMHYMLIDPRIESVTVACLVAGQRYFMHTIKRDEHDIEALRAAEQEFYDMCVNDIEPPLTIAPDQFETFDMDDDVADLALRYLEVSNAARAVNKELDAIKKGLIQLVGQNKEQIGQHVSVSYKYITQRRLDAEAVLKDSGLERDKYLKETGYYKLHVKETK